MSLVNVISGSLQGISSIITAAKSLNEKDRLLLQQAMTNAELELKNQLSKDGVNLEDAKSVNKFQSYWRPFLGWIMSFTILIILTHAICRSVFTQIAPLDDNVYMTLSLLASVLFGVRGAEKMFNYRVDSKYNSLPAQKPK